MHEEVSRSAPYVTVFPLWLCRPRLARILPTMQEYAFCILLSLLPVMLASMHFDIPVLT